MTTAFFRSAWTDQVNVDKAFLRNGFRDHVPYAVANVAALNALDTAGIQAVLVGGNFYDLDPADTSSADNGDTILVSASGDRYKRTAPTAAQAAAAVSAASTASAAATAASASATSAQSSATSALAAANAAAASAASAVSATGVREKLTANRFYYVSTTGSDSNSGLSAAVPLLTVQAAVAKALALDPSIYDVIIQLAPGTHSSASVGADVFAPLLSGKPLYIDGAIGSAQNYILTGVNAAINAYYGAKVHLRGVTLESSGGDAVRAVAGASVFTEGVRWGTCGRFHIELENATLEKLGTDEIIGDAGYHLYVGQAASFFAVNAVTNITGSRTFSDFIYASAGQYQAWNQIFGGGGSVTGRRYAALLNGTINTFGKGANHFPGDVAGVLSSGGQYA